MFASAGVTTRISIHFIISASPGFAKENDDLEELAIGTIGAMAISIAVCFIAYFVAGDYISTTNYDQFISGVIIGDAWLRGYYGYSTRS